MTCPRCGAKDKWRVIGKKNRPDGIRRRRECTECLSRFRSMEVLGKEIKPRYCKKSGRDYPSVACGDSSFGGSKATSGEDYPSVACGDSSFGGSGATSGEDYPSVSCADSSP